MPKKSLKDLKVLVVEDEEFSQKIVVMVLNNLGIKDIVVAKNGLAAIECLTTAVEPVDLVISDIEMPEMGGFELARKIRLGVAPKLKNVPILLLTGHSTEENLQKGRIHRIQGFIVKPPSADVLKRYIERAVKDL